MKRIIYITISLLFVFCTGKRPNEVSHTADSLDSIKNEKIKTDTTSEAFFNLFSDIEPVGFHIYPHECNDTEELAENQFLGKKINVNKFSFCDDKNIFLNIQACKDGYSDIYAIGKFKINDMYIGLIIRQFSQYTESLIQLLLWDIHNERVLKGVDLADAFGDAGWSFDMESWIIDYPDLKIVTRRKDSEYNEDFTTETFTDSIKTTLFRDGRFVVSFNELNDTVKYKLRCF